jgi:hypothetical protein
MVNHEDEPCETNEYIVPWLGLSQHDIDSVARRNTYW